MKLKCFIYAFHVDGLEGHHYTVDCHDMSAGGWNMVEERELEFEPPPEAVLVAGTIAAYRAEQQRIRAEASVKVNAIEESIQHLLAIEYKPDEAAEVAQTEL